MHNTDNRDNPAGEVGQGGGSGAAEASTVNELQGLTADGCGESAEETGVVGGGMQSQFAGECQGGAPSVDAVAGLPVGGRTNLDASPAGKNAENRRSLAMIGSRVVSTVLQPLLMPLYALLIILNANSYMALLVPFKVKLFLVITVTFCTLVIPALTLGLLNVLGLLEDLRMNVRRERVLPLGIILVTYGFCAYIIYARTAMDLAFIAVMAAIVCILLALVVTPFWKISLHMIGVGGVYALLLFLGMAEQADFTGAMIVATILVGLLAASRLYLGRHTLAQVAAGFFGGFVVSALTILFI